MIRELRCQLGLIQNELVTLHEKSRSIRDQHSQEITQIELTKFQDRINALKFNKNVYKLVGRSYFNMMQKVTGRDKFSL